MATIRSGALWLVLTALVLSTAGIYAADEPVRGLVVDRGDSTLWLGLPAPVPKGTVFLVYLTPGNQPIARAVVTDITPDAPYVAKAKAELLERDAFIPVGAYVEVTGAFLPSTDTPDGFKAVDLHRESARRISFRAGAFFPLNEDLKDETGSVWPSFQLAYRLRSDAGASTEIGVGYYHGHGDFSLAGIDGTRDFSAVPVTLDLRIPMSGYGYGGWFARAGVGAYLIRDRRTLGEAATSEDMGTFGWQAGFGYVSKSGASVEIYYTGVSKTDFQGVVFSLGARF